MGVSFGGVLTLELARLLEAEGLETRVVLLDGAVETIRSKLELLNQGEKLDTNLICRLLQIGSMKVDTNLHIVFPHSCTYLIHCKLCVILPCLSVVGSFPLRMMYVAPTEKD